MRSQRSIIKRFIAFTTTMMVMSTITISVCAQSTVYDYVSLGDSLAAGQNPYGITEGYGYTDILAGKLSEMGVLGNYVKLGKSGYTTEDVLNQLLDSEVRAEIENAEFITLDIGANDLLDPLIGALYNPEYRSYLDSYVIPNTLYNIKEILSEIHELNSDAEIYVMGYYNALPGVVYSLAYQGYPELDDVQKAYFCTALEGFNSQLESTVEGVAIYVPTDVAMDKHLVQYLPGDIHPTVQGYRAIAKEFWEKIKLEVDVD